MSSTYPIILAIDPAASSMTNFIGSLLLGNLFSWGLFGVLSTQVYMYSQTFTEDPTKIKLVVYSTYILQAAQIILYTHDIWRSLAAGFGDFSAVITAKSAWFSICVLGGIVTFSVQSFYAWRISVISGKKFPSLLIFTLSLLAIASANVVAADIKAKVQLPKLGNPLSLAKLGIWQGSTACCDVMIAVCMTYFLKHRAPAEELFSNSKTINVVNRIIRLTIETGSLTASVAIISLVLSFVPPGSGFNLCPLCVISGIYSCTLLVVLNSRIKFKVASFSTTWQDGPSDMRISVEHIRQTDSMTGDSSSVTNGYGITVAVHQDSLARDTLDNNWNLGKQERSDNLNRPLQSKALY